jgi:hypothetical protein
MAPVGGSRPDLVDRDEIGIERVTAVRATERRWVDAARLVDVPASVCPAGIPRIDRDDPWRIDQPRLPRRSDAAWNSLQALDDRPALAFHTRSFVYE